MSSDNVLAHCLPSAPEDDKTGKDARGAGSGRGAARGASGGAAAAPVHDTGAEVFKAYAPYPIIIVIFSIASTSAFKTALAEQPWTYKFGWPGLNVFAPGADEPLASTVYTFNWLPAAGTLMIAAGIVTALVLRISPARALAAYGKTFYELRWAILTVLPVPLPHRRLDRGRRHGVRHVRERPLRCPAGADGGAGRARPGAPGGGQLLGRRHGQAGEPVEPRHRGRGRRHGRQGG